MKYNVRCYEIGTKYTSTGTSVSKVQDDKVQPSIIHDLATGTQTSANVISIDFSGNSELTHE